MENFSNQLTGETAFLKVTVQFMGSGLGQANGTFRQEKASPDFTVQMRLLKTSLRSLNGMMSSYSVWIHQPP